MIRFLSTRLRPLTASALLGAAACGGSSDPASPPLTGIWAGHVAAAPAAAGITVQNNTTAPIGYFAIEADLAARTLWGPCTAKSGCPQLAPGGPHLIPFASVSGYTNAAQQVIFYWWHLVPGRNGALRPDSVRAVSIAVGG